MEKPATTDHPIHDVLRVRWSPRAFDPRAVEPDKLLSLLEAARWAPSSSNEQPWHFIVAAQATSMGLMAHQMAGFHRDRAREVFAIPVGHEPVNVIAVGYPGDPSTLPDDLQRRERRPRERKSLAEFVYAGRWGHTAPLVE
ncbi:MAG: hypothetical protein CL878_07795 [Dehalococcoidia bacterium]|nr:hypothetical protein [Dehalococcoidia bacterium]